MTRLSTRESPNFESHAARERYRSLSTEPVLYFSESVLEFTQFFVNGPLHDAKCAFHRCARRWLANWEMVLLVELRSEDLTQYYTRLLHKDFPATELQEDGHFLKQLFDWAVRAGYLGKSPFEGIPTLRRRRRRRAVAWDQAEQERLLDTCRTSVAEARAEGPYDTNARDETTQLVLPISERLDDLSDPVSWHAPRYLYPLVLIGLRTGLRLGDLLYLTWDEVRIDTARIRIAAGNSRHGQAVDIGLDEECVAQLQQLADLSAKLPQRPDRVFDVVDLPVNDDIPDYCRVQVDVRVASIEAGVRLGEFNSLRASFGLNCARAGISLSEVELLVDWDDLVALAKTYDRHYFRALRRRGAARS